jgi:hypothetical protein
MNPMGVLPLASMLASLAGRWFVIAVAASAPQGDAGAAAPTAKEQALMEHTCRLVQTGLAHDAYERCLEARLLSLRADFGPDLTRLSAASRAKIDAACSAAQASLGRDGYLDCLTGQLASLAARARAAVPAQGGAAPPGTDVAPVFEDSPPVSAQPSSFLSVRAAAVAAAGVVAAAALIFFGVRARRQRRACRGCGVRVDGSADLCSACRRDAAEAVRQAANERAEQRRAVEAEERRQQEGADRQRLGGARREEQEQQRRLDEERRAVEEAARREAIARREAEERRRVEAEAAGDADQSVFEPYAALGLPPGASDAEIRAAYEEARLKYDPEEVAHLGYDAKQHFARKWRAIERAYRTLAPEQSDRVIG